MSNSNIKNRSLLMYLSISQTLRMSGFILYFF